MSETREEYRVVWETDGGNKVVGQTYRTLKCAKRHLRTVRSVGCRYAAIESRRITEVAFDDWLPLVTPEAGP